MLNIIALFLQALIYISINTVPMHGYYADHVSFSPVIKLIVYLKGCLENQVIPSLRGFGHPLYHSL